MDIVTAIVLIVIIILYLNPLEMTELISGEHKGKKQNVKRSNKR